MPRAIQSKGSQILGFFRTAPLVVAALVLNLAKETVRERGATKAPTVKKAPAKAKKPVAAKPAPAAAVKAQAKRKRVRTRRRATTPVVTEAELENLGDGTERDE